MMTDNVRYYLQPSMVFNKVKRMYKKFISEYINKEYIHEFQMPTTFVSYYKSRYYHVYKRYGCLMSNNEITNRIIYLLSNKYLIGGNPVGIKNFLTLNIYYNRA